MSGTLIKILVGTCIATLFGQLAVCAEPITLVFSTPNSIQSQHVICGIKFKELVEQYSDGRMEVELHYIGGPKPNIGSDEDNARAISKGKGLTHAAIIAVNNAAVYAPSLGFMSLPYMFVEPDDAERLFKSDFMKHEVQQMMIQQGNFRALGWLVGGFRHLTNSKKEVRTLADLHGLKIRTPQNPIMLATYKAFGAEVIPIKWTDLFHALQTGTVDGQENPYTLIADQRFWEANQQYITENGPILWIGPLFISETFYQSIPKDLQDVLDKAGAEAAEYEWEWVKQQTKNARKVLEANGMKITQPDNKQEWIDAVQPVWPQFYAFIGDGNAENGRKIVEQALHIISTN